MGYDLRTDTDLQAEAKRRLFKEASKRGLKVLEDEPECAKVTAMLKVRSFTLQSGGGHPSWHHITDFNSREVAEVVCDILTRHSNSSPDDWRVVDNLNSVLIWNIETGEMKYFHG